MEIRKLNIAEIPDLIKLYNEIIPKEVKNEIKVIQKKYQEIINNDNYIILVAEEDGMIVGTATGICCEIIAFGGKNFLVIEDVSVLPKSQGKGIGRKLFEALDHFALEKNCGYSIIVSSAFRVKAHNFYEKIGYIDDVKGFRKMY